MKNNRNIRIFSGIMLVLFLFGLGFCVFGFSNSLGEIKNEVISKTPTVVLANMKIEDKSDVDLLVSYYDQRADECINIYDAHNSKLVFDRQFEWTKCGYMNRGLEQGLVESKLSGDYLPVIVGGKMTSNRGMKNMERWFGKVNGKSENYIGHIKLGYSLSGTDFSFKEESFYPLDDIDFSDGDYVNSDGHNHLFTMNFAVPFMVLGGGEERFTITADDDTFVFVGDDLVIDMGGIHEATEGMFMISEDGDVISSVTDGELVDTGIKLKKGEESIVRIFHADRDSRESVFGIDFSKMDLMVTDSRLADGTDGVQIAYDPTDPSYVAPLGVNETFRPDGTRGYVILATIQGLLIVAFAVLIVFLVRYIVRQKIKINS